MVCCDLLPIHSSRNDSLCTLSKLVYINESIDFFSYISVGGVKDSIVAFEALDQVSIPGRRKYICILTMKMLGFRHFPFVYKANKTDTFLKRLGRTVKVNFQKHL